MKFRALLLKTNRVQWGRDYEQEHENGNGNSPDVKRVNGTGYNHEDTNGNELGHEKKKKSGKGVEDEVRLWGLTLGMTLYVYHYLIFHSLLLTQSCPPK